MEMDKSLTHINERGEMNIVDISDKVETKREALAEGYINFCLLYTSPSPRDS